MSDTMDFFEGADDMVVTDGNELMEFAREAIQLKLDIEALEEQVSQRKSRLNELLSRDIPNLMAEQKLTEFKHESGWAVKAEHAVNPSLPRDQEKRTERLEKLKPLGVDEITNETIEFRFPVGDNRPALLLDFAKQNELPATHMVGVHASTFGAWLREKVAQGFGAELTEAGIWHGKHAKLVKPK